MKLKGMKELERSLLKLGKEFGDPKYALQALRPAMKKAMKPVEANIRANTPVADGDLKDSVNLKVKKSNKKDKQVLGNDSVMVAEAGWFWRPGQSTFRKAIAVEYGTSTQEPQPVLRNALDSHANSLIQEFRSELIKSIEKKTKQLRRKSKK